MELKNRNEALSTVVNPNLPDWVEMVRSHVESLRFGLIQIVVHDSRIVQIEKTEKVRLNQRCGPDALP